MTIIDAPVLKDGAPPSKDQLPEWQFEDDEEDDENDEDTKDENEGDDGEDDDDEGQDDSDAEMDDDGPEARTVSVTILSAEYDDLLARFGVLTLEELSTAIHDCLVGGVMFSLDPKTVDAALAMFKAETVGELSSKIKKQLLKSIKQ